MNLFDYLLDPQNWSGIEGIPKRLLEHLSYTAISVVIAAVLAIPLGILIGHTRRGSLLVIGVSNAARAIPSLGLLVLVVLLLGTGNLPIILVLAVLAVPSILTATTAGVEGADPEAVYSARALGMTGGQIVSQVEWPLALPLVVSGVRSATLQVVATATVAAYAAGGGLGRLLIDGQARNDYSQMFAGAVLVAALAIVLDVVIGGIGLLVGRRVRPRGKTSRAAVGAAA
ncbi:MAG TPA: ABC transporter permease subunit [Propionibacteriaceae bacterium]|jgi:osmoprotectant transport system permease protein